MDIKNTAITATMVIQSLINLLENEDVDISSVKFKVGSESNGYESPEFELEELIDLAYEGLEKIKQQATPEGFVLVPTENISTFYQDDSEPENFCTYEADLDILGDGLDKGEIMVVNKYTQAELTKEKFYGAWCEIETTFGTSRKFKIFKTYDEAKQAMIEAQEQSHD